MRLARTLAFVVFSLTLAGCKFGFTNSTIKEGEQAATTSDQTGQFPLEQSTQLAYHGMTVSSSSEGEMVALGDPIPDDLGNDITNQNVTAIASNTNTSSGTSSENGETISGIEQTAFALAGGAKTAYMTNCESQGVPLPPAWGDPAWVKEGLMTTIVVLEGRKTELWTSRAVDGSGVCAALPRFDTQSGRISFMGVICSNMATGKTCFYDNVSGGAKVAVKKGYEVSDGEGGDQLGENCSNCHRGDDPWIVIPGQLTANLPKPSALYAPIGQATWSNPTPGPKEAQCADGCHAIPQLTVEYCGIGNAMIRGFIMPQGVLAGTVGDGVKEFKAACATVK